MDNIPRSHRLGVFLPRLDPVWLCAEIRTGSPVVTGGSVCIGAYQQARGGDALHNLWWLCLWLGGLQNEIICMAISDSLVYRHVYYHCRCQDNLDTMDKM